MSSPQVPKYQAIYSLLRQKILDGEFAPGSQLPPQAELAASFKVTLMTLRQAIGALEADGLVIALRGKGTFISENPVDISLGNLSSFAQQMRAAGIQMTTNLVGVSSIPVASHQQAMRSLETEGDLVCIARLRSVDDQPFSLQRSYLSPELGVATPGQDFVDESLYEAIEAATGWVVARAAESMAAIGLNQGDAELLLAPEGHPAILSIRVSINQFDQPFLYDEALLVGGRCVISADRTADRLSLNYGVSHR